MDAVAGECKRMKHHPEWSNVSLWGFLFLVGRGSIGGRKGKSEEEMADREHDRSIIQHLYAGRRMSRRG